MTGFNDIKKRLAIASLKWSIWIISMIVLWKLKIIQLIFLLGLLLANEMWRFMDWLAAPTKIGAVAYWSQYWTYWAVAYTILIFFFMLWWFAWYRHKRPVLKIDGLPEGRVIWMKGIRRGLVYDVWDAKRYLRWWYRKVTKKKVSKLKVMANGGVPEPLWPSPLAIPLGNSDYRYRNIYFCRPWRMRIERLEIPIGIMIHSSYLTVDIPRGSIISRPDPERPGRLIYRWSRERARFERHDPKRPVNELDTVLEIGRSQVMAATAANPEIISEDFLSGSIPIWRSKNKS